MKPAENVTDECVFCQIIGGLAPGNVVREWPDAIALVPLTPVVEGHVLIIPKRHVAHAAEAPYVTARTMGHAAEHASRYDSFNLITSAGRAATQSIDHLHIHVVPRAADDQLMTPWGTVYGDDPSAPHWCRTAARVLEDAADDWQRGEWANAPRRADRVQERIANGQYVGDWLRARAAGQTSTAAEGSSS